MRQRFHAQAFAIWAGLPRYQRLRLWNIDMTGMGETMTGIEILKASDRKPQPWKNGGGTTREVCAFPPGATLDGFDWRLSMATVAKDGPFSAFPGIDRVLIVLAGGGLDLTLPDGQGMALLRRWRRAGLSLPVIVITARTALQDRLDGLDGGADDYVLKPFDVPELLSRLHAVLRRSARRCRHRAYWVTVRCSPGSGISASALSSQSSNRASSSSRGGSSPWSMSTDRTARV